MTDKEVIKLITEIARLRKEISKRDKIIKSILERRDKIFRKEKNNG